MIEAERLCRSPRFLVAPYLCGHERGPPAHLPLLPQAHEAVPYHLEGGFPAFRFPLFTLQSYDHQTAEAVVRDYSRPQTERPS